METIDVSDVQMFLEMTHASTEKQAGLPLATSGTAVHSSYLLSAGVGKPSILICVTKTRALWKYWCVFTWGRIPLPRNPNTCMKGTLKQPSRVERDCVF